MLPSIFGRLRRIVVVNLFIVLSKEWIASYLAVRQCQRRRWLSVPIHPASNYPKVKIVSFRCFFLRKENIEYSIFSEDAKLSSCISRSCIFHLLTLPQIWSCIFRLLLFFRPPFSASAFSVHPKAPKCTDLHVKFSNNFSAV